MKCDFTSLEDNFYGSATVGERGQVVIPAEARKKFNINPGDKVLVISHPTASGIVLCKIDALREMLSSLLQGLDSIESAVEQGTRSAVADGSQAADKRPEDRVRPGR